MRLMWTASMTPFSACLSGPHCAAGDGKRNTRNNSALIALWSRVDRALTAVRCLLCRGRQKEQERQTDRERGRERGRDHSKFNHLKKNIYQKHMHPHTPATTHKHTEHAHTHAHTQQMGALQSRRHRSEASLQQRSPTHTLPPLTLSFTPPVSSTKVAHTHFTFTV